MLSVDTSGTLAKVITPSFGLPEQEVERMRTSMRKITEDWLLEREKGQHAWSMCPYDRSLMDQVRERAKALRALAPATVLWIGIGGSSLGTRVIQDACALDESVELLILDTVDPAVVERTLQEVEWRRTILIVASKSGATLEPLSVFFLAFHRLRATLGSKEALQRTLVLTEIGGGMLRSIAIQEGIPVLPLPSNVGGRFSIFTAIGLLPLELLGGDVSNFLRGAKEMDTLCQQTDLLGNPASKLATIQYLLDVRRGYPLRVCMPYSARLWSLALWEQQLVAESLGKSEATGPTPMAAIGTQDQHSLLQQWMAGRRLCWHLFLRIAEHPRLPLPAIADPTFAFLAGRNLGDVLDASYEGTAQALTRAKRPHVTITLPRLDAYHVGQLVFLLMTEVVFLGKLYRIDPYGQPAVELGKQIALAWLRREK